MIDWDEMNWGKDLREHNKKQAQDSISIIWWVLVIALAGMLVLMAMSGHATEFPIRYIHDGDTIMTTLPLPAPLNDAAVRIRGIDTPELHGKCEFERQKAQEARGYLIALVGNAKTMDVTKLEWDKYGGRLLGDVVVNGKNVTTEMINSKLARPYNGEAKKPWCN